MDQQISPVTPVSYRTPVRRPPVWQRINLRLMLFLVLVICLVGYPVYIYVDMAISGGIKDRGDYKEVDLMAMSLFPFSNTAGTIEDVPRKWRDLDGQKVEVVGEMWQPYSAGNQVKGFELVYSISKCCLQGPPQIQHFVHARVVDGRSVGYYSGPVRVRGTLHVRVTRDENQVTGVYHMDVESVEPVS